MFRRLIGLSITREQILKLEEQHTRLEELQEQHTRLEEKHQALKEFINAEK